MAKSGDIFYCQNLAGGGGAAVGIESRDAGKELTMHRNLP